ALPQKSITEPLIGLRKNLSSDVVNDSGTVITAPGRASWTVRRCSSARMTERCRPSPGWSYSALIKSILLLSMGFLVLDVSSEIGVPRLGTEPRQHRTFSHR